MNRYERYLASQPKPLTLGDLKEGEFFRYTNPSFRHGVGRVGGSTGNSTRVTYWEDESRGGGSISAEVRRVVR